VQAEGFHVGHADLACYRPGLVANSLRRVRLTNKARLTSNRIAFWQTYYRLASLLTNGTDCEHKQYSDSNVDAKNSKSPQSSTRRPMFFEREKKACWRQPMALRFL
jgi:hypothetical protein